jgi:hypothetical protein
MQRVNNRVFLRSGFVLAVISAALVLRAYFTHPTAKPMWRLALGVFGVAAATGCIVVFWRAHKNGTVAHPWPLILGPLGVVQLFAGLAITLGYIGAPDWIFYTCIGISFSSLIFNLTRGFFRA